MDIPETIDPDTGERQYLDALNGDLGDFRLG